MKENLRQSMAWLHTWSGLLLGWLLFVMFACGTAAYFQDEITRWMQPEVTAPSDPDLAAENAVRWLTAKAPDATQWYITLPGKRSAVTSLYWSLPDGAPEGASTEATLDGQGKPVTARQTAGGYFLYRFHFDLHYLPVIWARYLVGLAAMFMLVAILSGIVTHKKIFADFFMLRFGKGQRSWLDAHNVTAVLALPFHLMITYTGLVTLDDQLAPAPVAALYQSRDAFYAEAFPEDEAGKAAAKPAPLAKLAPMLAEARKRWGAGQVGYIQVERPRTSMAEVSVQSSAAASLNARGKTLVFEGTTGKLLKHDDPSGAARDTEGVMIGLHAGRYADTALRWLYFLSGLGGTAMVGTGLILWTVKRRAKLADPAHPHLGFRIVERLNIAVIVGFPIGLAVYFLANRLLPLGLADRPDHEIDSLFIAWAAASVFALARPTNRAWTELCAVAAAAFCAVPAISALTTQRGLFTSLAHADWVYVGFDLAMLALGAAFGLASFKLARRQVALIRTRSRKGAAA